MSTTEQQQAAEIRELRKKVDDMIAVNSKYYAGLQAARKFLALAPPSQTRDIQLRVVDGALAAGVAQR